ncbi:MAG: hypothetical protein ACTSQI_22575, partial [Candidatus Helarchaeota archaeon]
ILMSDDDFIGISASDERIQFDAGGDIEIMGANVGIGTTSPDELLHVEGGSIKIWDTGANAATAPGLIIKEGTRDPWELYQMAGGNNLRLNFGGNDFVTFDYLGYVGIGTTGPLSLLNIESSAPKLTISNSDISIIDEQEIGSLAFYAKDGSGQGTGEFAKISAIAEATGEWDNQADENGATSLGFFTTSVSGGIHWMIRFILVQNLQMRYRLE